MADKTEGDNGKASGGVDGDPVGRGGSPERGPISHKSEASIPVDRGFFLPWRTLEQSVIALLDVSKKLADLREFMDRFQGDTIVAVGLHDVYKSISRQRLDLIKEIKKHVSSNGTHQGDEGDQKEAGGNGEDGRRDDGGEKSGDRKQEVLPKGADKNIPVRRPPSKEMEQRVAGQNDQGDGTGRPG